MMINDTIQSVRRFIGDTDSTNYIYQPEDLRGYIEDAIDELGFNIIIENDDYKEEISKDISIIIAIKTSILIKNAEKNKADRDNFLLRKGKLTIDNTNQPNNHLESIEILEKKLKQKIFYYNSKKGVRLE